MSEPAKLKGMRQATGREIELGHREVKMLRPICDVCAPNTKRVAPGWEKNCPHHPYIGTKTETVTERVYEDGPDGTRVVTGSTSTTTERPWPNFVQIATTLRINSGQGVEKARAKGYILPTELVDDAFPDGIAPFCEMSNCFVQEGLKEYPTGTFCRAVEAAHVYEDERGVTIEFYDQGRRRDQVADAISRVGAGR